MKYTTVQVINSSIFMEEGVEKLMGYLNDGWQIVSVHNQKEGSETIYVLSKKL